MSIFTDIEKWVKGWRLDKFFKGLVDGDKEAAKQLQATVEQSNEFVNRVRAWLLNPIGDIITAVIPGDWDSDLRAKGIAVLNTITQNNAPLLGCVQLETVGQQLSCIYSKVISIADPNKTKSFLEEFGTTSALIFADGRLDWSDIGLAAKLVFKFITKKKD